jgi:hypothetical protein
MDEGLGLTTSHSEFSILMRNKTSSNGSTMDSKKLDSYKNTIVNYTCQLT